MNWKGCRRKRYQPNFVILEFPRRVWGKARQICQDNRSPLPKFEPGTPEYGSSVPAITAKFGASQSQSYVTTDGQPASLSWNKAPIWGLRPDLDYCLTVAGLLIWGALSDERTGVPFALLLVLASAVIFGSESRGHILLSQIRDFPFRRLLRLAGSRWRYSTTPAHGLVRSISLTEHFI
jgi:hypothetical protein